MKSHGKWGLEHSDMSYMNDINIPTATAQSGNEVGTWECARSRVSPPAELLAFVFPQAEEDLAVIKQVSPLPRVVHSDIEASCMTIAAC